MIEIVRCALDSANNGNDRVTLEREIEKLDRNINSANTALWGVLPDDDSFAVLREKVREAGRRRERLRAKLTEGRSRSGAGITDEQIARLVKARLRDLGKRLRAKNWREVRDDLEAVLTRVQVLPDGAIEAEGSYAPIVQGINECCAMLGEAEPSQSMAHALGFHFRVAKQTA